MEKLLWHSNELVVFLCSNFSRIEISNILKMEICIKWKMCRTCTNESSTELQSLFDDVNLVKQLQEYAGVEVYFICTTLQWIRMKTLCYIYIRCRWTMVYPIKYVQHAWRIFIWSTHFSRAANEQTNSWGMLCAAPCPQEAHFRVSRLR